jgi:heme/copper-type cytochrome/quinol oxidase subunit 2
MDVTIVAAGFVVALALVYFLLFGRAPKGAARASAKQRVDALLLTFATSVPIPVVITLSHFCRMRFHLHLAS